MADLSVVDIESVVYSLQCGSSRLKKTANTRGLNLCGPCPKCHGNDRFYVLPEAEDSSGNRRGKWACRNCHPQEGDAIELLVHMDGLTSAQAFTRLKELFPDLPGGSASSSTKKGPRVRLPSETAVPPSVQWQERAKLVMDYAIKRLWSDKGRPGREYLLQRSITEETMQAAGIGFIAQDIWDIDCGAWGITDREIEGIYIPHGILFPYIYKGDIWKLQVRRIDPDVPKEKRYPVVTGSANGLYRADTLKVNHPALLFEGPINALSATQAIGDLAACVATGGAGQARIDRWKMRLALASQVLLCFDGDESGKNAVTYWHERLRESASYLPASDGCKDANDMLVAGIDLVSWVAAHLVKLNGTNDTESLPTSGDRVPQTFLAVPPKNMRPAWANFSRDSRGLLTTCSQCLNDAVWYGMGCTPYCDGCWPGTRHKLEVVHS